MSQGKCIKPNLCEERSFKRTKLWKINSRDDLTFLRFNMEKNTEKRDISDKGKPRGMDI